MNTKLLGLFTALVLGSATAAAAEPDGSPAAQPPSAEQVTPPEGERSFRIRYTTRVPRPVPAAERVEVWVPLPYESAVQKVRDLTVQAPIPHEVTVDKTTGNRMVHVLSENPASDLVIVWTATVTRVAEAGQEAAGDTERYLMGDRLAPVDDTARKMAAGLGLLDSGEAVRDRARRIFDHVLQTTAYDKATPGWGTGDFARVCSVGKGNCTDFSAHFMTIARAAGIPARFACGIQLSESEGGTDRSGYHCYCYFADQGRWIPLDSSEAWKAREADPAKSNWLFGHVERRNVTLSVGRDLTLSPPQQGPALNFFPWPYLEVNGAPVEVPGANRTFTFEPI